MNDDKSIMPGLIPFYLVDVFATEPLAGNPLAVVPDAEALDAVTMAKMAREFNQSETTFIVPASAGADWRLRSFTAAGIEVFGAGHNSLGAWWWLAESGRLALTETGGDFIQEIGTHRLPVRVDCAAGRLVSVGLTQTPPVFGPVLITHAELAAALGLALADLTPELIPTQVVSTGAAHLLVAVKDRDAIARAHPDLPRLARLLAAFGGQGCYLFCLEPEIRARFFNPTEGIPEDAATGSAAGPLACHLVHQLFVKDNSTVWIEQGYEMGRPSRIEVRISGELVRVYGHCVTAAEGKLKI
jgi:trans-2,3-dihydro-3-hydroxyanthranilate isomerase